MLSCLQNCISIGVQRTGFSPRPLVAFTLGKMSWLMRMPFNIAKTSLQMVDWLKSSTKTPNTFSQESWSPSNCIYMIIGGLVPMTEMKKENGFGNIVERRLLTTIGGLESQMILVVKIVDWFGSSRMDLLQCLLGMMKFAPLWNPSQFVKNLEFKHLSLERVVGVSPFYFFFVVPYVK